MNSFYVNLQAELADAKEELWVQTQIDGAEAGKKILLKGEPKDTDSVFVDEKGERIFQERISRPAKLVICGAGHVSMPIIRMGKMLGFHVTVVEDRPKFADDARRAEADQVYCEPFEDGLAKIKGDTDTWFVIVTRGHRYDTDCLRTILGKPRAYVGMMGSKRRTEIVKDQLEAEGVERDVLEAVHTPIGLKIAAETPEEIAVSIMAEIIQIKNSRAKSGGYSSELLEEILKEDECGKVLATIISRKGSAPRGVGTKMLVCGDGRIIDTIGGGCVESEIIQKALLMIRTEQEGFQVCKVDMTAEAAVKAAEEIGVNLIIQTSAGTVEHFGAQKLYDIVDAARKGAKIEVALHLDHCRNKELGKLCADTGWDSIMMDFSHLPFEENIANTREMAEYAHSRNVAIEGEIGVISGVEEEIVSDEAVGADFEETMEFVERSQIDAVAPAIGTAHGIYHGVPKINFELVEKLGKEKTPVVIHGGSGLSAETFTRLIELGGRKVNISTLVKNAYLDKTKELILSGEKFAPIPFDTEVENAVKEEVKKHLEVFSGKRTSF